MPKIVTELRNSIAEVAHSFLFSFTKRGRKYPLAVNQQIVMKYLREVMKLTEKRHDISVAAKYKITSLSSVERFLKPTFWKKYIGTRSVIITIMGSDNSVNSNWSEILYSKDNGKANARE